MVRGQGGRSFRGGQVTGYGGTRVVPQEDQAVILDGDDLTAERQRGAMCSSPDLQAAAPVAKQPLRVYFVAGSRSPHL